MSILAALTWQTILKAAALFVGGVCVPAGIRIARNVGKTKQEIAEEDLARAFDRAEKLAAAAEKAHQTPDPSDDGPADAAAEKARTLAAEAKARVERLRVARSVIEGLGTGGA